VRIAFGPVPTVGSSRRTIVRSQEPQPAQAGALRRSRARLEVGQRVVIGTPRRASARYEFATAPRTPAPAAGDFVTYLGELVTYLGQDVTV
jgi:hypothetical protein